MQGCGKCNDDPSECAWHAECLADMREGFNAQRKDGVNVDWFTWQIAWFDCKASIAAKEKK
jgi:hypothetical protein